MWLYVMYCEIIDLVETEAELLREAKCRNVYIEPSLLPTSAQFHPKGTITADGARLDIVATGLYGKNEKNFHGRPNNPSQCSIKHVHSS